MNEWSSVPHREEDLLRLLHGALVLSPVRLRGGRAGAREPLDRGLELVQRPLLPAVRRRGRVGAAPVCLLLERAAAQERRAAGGGGGRLGRRAAEAGVGGEVDDRGGGGHGAAARWIRKDSAISPVSLGAACSLVACSVGARSSPFGVFVLASNDFPEGRVPCTLTVNK